MSDYTINVSVAISGQITTAPSTLDVVLDEGEDKTINFVLAEGTFLGIKIAADESALAGLPPTLDTQGAYYQDTCFIVSSPDSQTLRLDDKDRPDLTDSGDWYYCLGVELDGEQIWHDPQVYNEGDAVSPSLHHKPQTPLRTTK